MFVPCQKLTVALAQRNYQPVQVAIGMGELLGVTHNRRAGESPYVQQGTIDPNVGIIRVDDLKGNPLVTLCTFILPTLLPSFKRAKPRIKWWPPFSVSHLSKGFLWSGFPHFDDYGSH